MIAIFGATGNTGGEAARQLLVNSRPVRVIGRQKSRLADLAKAGGEAVQADLESPEDVARALDGVEAAYLMIPPNFAVEDFRAYQKLVARNMSSAVRGSHCRKVVVLSSLGAQHPSGTGPIVGLYELEQQLRAVPGLDVLSIRAGFFMENFLGNVDMVRSMGVLGAPAPAEAPLYLIAAADIGRYAAARLGRLDFRGFEVVNLVGPRQQTFAEVTRTIGEAIDKPNLRFVQFSDDDARAGMIASGLREPMAELYVELYHAAAAGLLQPEARTPVVSTSTQLVEFAQVFAAIYRGASAA